MSLATKALRTRWLVRAPIVVFRARLGFLFGRRLLLLEHLGRTSKVPRYVVLEAVERPTSSTIIVASGFGEQSQWYQNVMANPRCHVSTGFAYRVPTVARRLSNDEATAVVEHYRVEHPTAYRKLSEVIEEAVGTSLADVPFVELMLD